MTKDEALRLALEALENASNAIESWGSYASEYFQDKHDLQVDINNTKQAITAIKAALEAKDEPDHSDELTIAYMSGLHRGKELAQRTWVGLTDEEIDKAWRSVDYTVPWDQHRIDIARAIEAKLKEKNT